MRPSHRVDVLTDGVIHYANQSSNNLSMFHHNNIIVMKSLTGYLLPQRYKRTITVQEQAKGKLNDIMKNSSGAFHCINFIYSLIVSFTVEDINVWYQEEKARGERTRTGLLYHYFSL